MASKLQRGAFVLLVTLSIASGTATPPGSLDDQKPRHSLLRSEASPELTRHEPQWLDATEAFADLAAASSVEATAASAMEIDASGASGEGQPKGSVTAATAFGASSDTQNCADKDSSGLTGSTLLADGQAKGQTCEALMYSYRHYATASACTDRKHGAVVRRNCQRSCGCCCQDRLHSGTHDDNLLEVTCAQLHLWTKELNFDYCADEQYGATIRDNCRQLCCTCDASVQLDHLWTEAGERDVNKSIPYAQVRQELNNAMHRISQLAEGVEAMAGRVPGIMGIISGSTTGAPRPHGAHGDTASTTPGSGYYDAP